MGETEKTVTRTSSKGQPVPRNKSLRFRLQLLLVSGAAALASSMLYSTYRDYTSELDFLRQDAGRIVNEMAVFQAQTVKQARADARGLADLDPLRWSEEGDCNRFMARLLDLAPRYQNLSVVDADGQVLCSGLPLERPLNIADRPYFQNVMRTGEFSYSGFILGRITKEPSVSFAYPLKSDGSSAPRGAVVAVLGLDWWSNFLDGKQLPDEVSAVILDNTGQIIALHPLLPERLGIDLQETWREIFGTNPPQNEMYTGADGKRRISARQVLFEFPGHGPMTMAVSIPVDDAISRARKSLAIKAVVFGFLILGLGLVGRRILHSTFLRPLGALEHSIQKFETGDLDMGTLDAEIAEVAEFRSIAHSFRQMAQKRLAAEAKEAARHGQLRALLSALPDVYLLLDENDRVLDFRGTSISDMIGPPEFFLGQPVVDIAPRSHKALFGRKLQELHQSREMVSWEYDVEIDGKAFDFEARACAIPATSETVLVLRNISEVKRVRERILHQAHTDFLTNLPNRARLTEIAEQSVAGSLDSGEPLVLIFVDLDGLKQVNDRRGHAIGDGLLKLVAQRLRSCVGTEDFVARHAGDEFIVLLRTDSADRRADAVAQRILAAMERPFEIGAEPIHVSASLGMAMCPRDAQTPQSLLSAADQAMYSAKSEGGGRIRHYTPEIGDSNAHRMRILDDLHVALAENQFELYFQPIVDLRTGRVAMAEALLRWNHPTLGVLTPNRFLPFVEEAGLMIELGDAGLRQACNDLVALRDRFGSGFQISINMSPTELSAREQGQGLDWADYIVRNTPDDASILVEITEAALLDATPFMQNSLQEFRKSGIEIALDDFGAGYSSLLYFLSNEFDVLKIDREFAQNAPESSRSAGLCETILGLSNRLGSRAIAEGIEREEQLRFFQQRGCAFGQGFLFSRALSKPDFLQFPTVLDLSADQDRASGNGA